MLSAVITNPQSFKNSEEMVLKTTLIYILINMIKGFTKFKIIVNCVK